MMYFSRVTKMKELRPVNRYQYPFRVSVPVSRVAEIIHRFMAIALRVILDTFINRYRLLTESRPVTIDTTQGTEAVHCSSEILSRFTNHDSLTIIASKRHPSPCLANTSNISDDRRPVRRDELQNPP